MGYSIHDYLSDNENEVGLEEESDPLVTEMSEPAGDDQDERVEHIGERGMVW